MGFLGRLSYEMIRSPITSLFAVHIGAPTQLVGLLVAAVTITGIFVKFPAGALADLFGFRRLMMNGLLVKASAPFLYLLARSWPVLLGVRLYHGLSTALYAPAASAQVARAYPPMSGGDASASTAPPRTLAWCSGQCSEPQSSRAAASRRRSSSRASSG